MNIPLITGGVDAGVLMLMEHIQLACSNKLKGKGDKPLINWFKTVFLFFNKLVEFEANQQTTKKIGRNVWILVQAL